MVQIPRWKIWLVAAVVLAAVLFALPNVTGTKSLPGFLPDQSINLGLDLRGGSHLLLQVDLSSVMKERAEDLVATTRRALRDERIGYKRLSALEDGMRVSVRDVSHLVDAKRIIREEIDPGLIMTDIAGDTIEVRYSPAALDEIKSLTIEQSIEIVRRRVDETGTNEPLIQRQGDDRILVQLPGLDNPERIKQLLGKTAKLTFHAVGEGQGLEDGGTITLPMAERPGATLPIARRPTISGDMLVHAAYAPDQNGNPAITFRFNSMGANRFCTFSSENVGRLFAIVLDNVIISAPEIQEAICGGSGQISGKFTLQEANDLAMLLRAGALPAPLTILEERTVGPSLGADSIAAGEMASLVGLLFVVTFMVVAYGTFGIYACVGLAVNIILIFAVLSGLQASLTLPGIAGIVLTIGMAVDANVLIYERIREELYLGKSPISAFHSGFSNALSSILDSNITTLISSVILMSIGSGPVKGFAVTLSIGVITSMFSAIVFTRLLLSFWMNRNRNKPLPI